MQVYYTNMLQFGQEVTQILRPNPILSLRTVSCRVEVGRSGQGHKHPVCSSWVVAQASGSLTRLAEWYREVKRAAFAQLAFHPHFAPMPLGNGFDNRQPQPRASGLL